VSTAELQTTQLPAIDLSDEALARLTAKLAETAEAYDRSAEFPWEPIFALHDAGVLRYGIAPEYGGTTATVTELTRLLYALGKGDPSVALIVSMTIMTNLLHNPETWPEGLYRGLVAESLERPVLFNHIRAEPELGAPARGGVPATKVRRTETGWVLNGHKAYGTGCEGLTHHLVWAATEDEEPLQGHVIVPREHPGIEIVRTWDHLGMRASSTHDVIYRDIEVPLDHFHGEPFDPKSLTGGGTSRHPGALLGLGLAISALYVGVARAAQEFFVKFAHERVPSALGKPIATTERIQTVAGEIEAQLMQADEVLYGLAARIDAGDEKAIARAPFAKLLATRNAITAVETAVAALGNPALTRSHPLERHLRDVLCCRIHPPQDDRALIALGKQSLATRAGTADH
jgi:alkylation response protein AidB-like acyl-CoA dehydrogenase